MKELILILVFFVVICLLLDRPAKLFAQYIDKKKYMRERELEDLIDEKNARYEEEYQQRKQQNARCSQSRRDY